MTMKEIQKILLHHSKQGFSEELKDLYSKISDLRASNTEIAGFTLTFAMPANRNVVSSVESVVMKNLTVMDLEVKAHDLERFIKRLNWTIENLPRKEHDVIKLRYFNKRCVMSEFKFISEQLHYDESWCRRLDKRALRKINSELSGATVLWNEIE